METTIVGMLTTLRTFGISSATLATVLVLAGCGGSGAKSTQRTITESASQANGQAQSHTAPPPNVDYLIRCGGRVTTNGSCVFADNLAKAVREAGTKPGLVVMRFPDGTVNPVTCARTSAGLRCKSRRSAVWVEIMR